MNQGILAIASKVAIATKSESRTQLARYPPQSDNCYDSKEIFGRMPVSPWPSLVTASALLIYLVFIINVGRARAQYKISPPQMTGTPDFERVVRVQQNTLEQLIIFLPSLWLFTEFVSPIFASAIGAVWLIGRILFAWGYYQAAEKRTIGFAITSLATFTLLGGSLIGIILQLLKVSP